MTCSAEARAETKAFLRDVLTLTTQEVATALVAPVAEAFAQAMETLAARLAIPALTPTVCAALLGEVFLAVEPRLAALLPKSSAEQRTGVVLLLCQSVVDLAEMAQEHDL